MNAFLAALCIFVTAHAGRKLGGETVGIVAGLCLLCTPPMWFSAAVFYTDFLTLLFPVLAFWLFLCGLLEQNVLWKSAGWYLYGLSIRPRRDGKTYRGNCSNCGHTDCIFAVQTQTGGCVCAVHRIVCRHVSDCA